jgi:hypothetical protein
MPVDPLDGQKAALDVESTRQIDSPHPTERELAENVESQGFRRVLAHQT